MQNVPIHFGKSLSKWIACPRTAEADGGLAYFGIWLTDPSASTTYVVGLLEAGTLAYRVPLAEQPP